MPHLVFIASEQLSTTLQLCKNTTTQDAHADRHKDPSAFYTSYQQVVSESQGRQILQPCLYIRYCRAPQHAYDESTGHTHRQSTPEDMYRQQYSEVMENLPEEITRRFGQKGFVLFLKWNPSCQTTPMGRHQKSLKIFDYLQ